jgi:cell division protein FtsA
MTNHTVCAVDLGSTKASCLIAKLDHDGKVEVKGFAAVPCGALRRGLIIDEEGAAKAAAKAIEGAEEEAGGISPSASVTLTGPHIMSMDSRGIVTITPTMRRVAEADILEAINHSRKVMMPAGTEEILHLPREFRIDGQRGIADPIGMPAARLEVVTVFAAGDTGAVQLLESAVAKTGKSGVKVLPSAVMAGVGLLSQEMMDLGAVVIDIGGDVTDIAVFADGGLAYTAGLPVGSAHITSDIRQLLKVTISEAERIKIDLGTADASVVDPEAVVDILQDGADKVRPIKKTVIAEIIEARVREIGQLAHAHIQQSGFEGKLTGGAVLAGGGSLLEGLPETMSAAMQQIKVRRDGVSVRGPHARRLKAPQYTAVVGLARHLLDSAEKEYQPVSSFSALKRGFGALKSRFGGS